MKAFPYLGALAAVLAMTACTDPDRFANTGAAGAGGGAGLNGGAGGAGASGIVPGSVNDPQSPVFFNQVIGDRVLFAVDTATLTPEGQSILDGQAQWLQTNSDFRAVIEGHADEQGTREYNIALGARRANAVREYLVSRGVSANRLEVISYGKLRPIAVCSDESCYAQNRRAVTVLSFAQMTS